MRFESLSLRIPGDQLCVRFHERLTVLSGLGAVERQGFTEALLGSLSGTHASSTELLYVDGAGRRITVVHEGGRVHYVDDGGLPVGSPLDAMGVDHDGLRELCLLRPADLGLPMGDVDMNMVPQLAEARSALQRLSEELEQAFASHQQVESMVDEMARLDERLRRAEEAWAEVRYAALLADLDQVRAEAAALRRATGGSETHRQFMALVRDAHDLAERWAQADSERQRLLQQFGDRARLDAATLAATPPTTEDAALILDELAQALHAAERRRDELQARLQEQTVSNLGQPAHPAVVQLAKQDQDVLWATAQRAIRAEELLEEQSLALGGVRPDGVQSSLADEIEDAHEAVFQAERVQQERKRAGFLGSGGAGLTAAALSPVAPAVAGGFAALGLVLALWMLVAPRRALKKVLAEEKKVLEKAGVPTYLAFHLRRVEATVDPRARQRLNEATSTLQAAVAEWHAMAGPITPVQALALKDEVTTYAVAIQGMGADPADLDQLRREFVEEAEPAVQEAMAAMMAACHRLGVDDPEAAIEVARHQTEVGVIARLQRDLEAAEAEEMELRYELDRHLTEVGFEGDDLSGRISSLQRLLLTAGDQEVPWTSTRSLAEVESELADLEARARRERPATWGTKSAVSTAPVDEQELEELRARRQALVDAYTAARRNLPDIADLADRRSALERRVTRLEATAGDAGTTGAALRPEDVARRLAARVDAMQAEGATDPLPFVLDEPFARLRADAKWQVLDVVEAFADHVQVIYVTDDADVVSWARRRASSGALRLLEPNEAVA